MNKKPRKFFVLKNFISQSTADRKPKQRKRQNEAVLYNDAVLEAEQIVNKYMENLGYTSPRPCKGGQTGKVLLASALFGIVASATYVIITKII